MRAGVAKALMGAVLAMGIAGGAVAQAHMECIEPKSDQPVLRIVNHLAELGADGGALLGRGTATGCEHSPRRERWAA